MPFTPCHFGPSGFVGLVFRKYIDLPVFVLANVVVDVEVLFAPGSFPHRYWHWHTLLIGAAVGVIWALAAYPLRGLFKKAMRFFRLTYETRLFKMVLSGVLGVWLHVLLDGLYHYDVQVFWPMRRNPLRNIISRQSVVIICLCCFVPAIVMYVRAVRSQKSRQPSRLSDKQTSQLKPAERTNG
jgi:hypothetical protein